MLKLEKLEHNRTFKKGDNDGKPIFHLYRAKIPGGWLVLMSRHHFSYDTVNIGSDEDHVYGYGWGYGGATFVPDPDHRWDGSSID